MGTFQEIIFGTPLYDETIALRHVVLREPLNLTFNVEDIELEWDQHHLVYMDEAESVQAICLFKKIKPTTLKMRQVAVHPSLQRIGIGKKLMRYAENWAKRHGFTHIELHARDTAINFYESLDYSISGKEFMEIGIPHKKMTKNLI